jgi:hypothetical protein
MQRGILAAAVAALVAAGCGAAPCAAEPAPAVSLELIRPFGDVYNERTTDGDAYPASLAARASFARAGYVLEFDWWRNTYLTQSGGAGSLTRYARIEGGFGTTAPFVATESSFEARLERRISRVLPLYAGAGAVHAWASYHYPSLTGLGAGIELRAASAAGLRPFGSAFYYPSASGTYVTETRPARTLTPSFGIVKLDAGLVLNGARSPLYAVLGYANEMRSGHALPSDVRFIRSDPYAGLGIRL